MLPRCCVVLCGQPRLRRLARMVQGSRKKIEAHRHCSLPSDTKPTAISPTSIHARRRRVESPPAYTRNTQWTTRATRVPGLSSMISVVPSPWVYVLSFQRNVDREY
jgi:hypothetical protein